MRLGIELLVIHLVHVLDELQHLVGVAHLVVVPADHLDKGCRNM